MLPPIRRVLQAHGVEAEDRDILDRYAALESAAESGEYKPYRTILREVMQGFGREYGFAVNQAEQNSLPDSLSGWPPFPDTVESLRALKRRYKLAIISNTDDDLFAGTARRLEVPFDFVITAQQVGSYKPSPRNFEAALARIGVPKQDLLHVAQSLFHDIAPANALGISNVWVKRRQGLEGFGATRKAVAQPNLSVPDLKTLVDMVERGS